MVLCNRCFLVYLLSSGSCSNVAAIGSSSDLLDQWTSISLFKPVIRDPSKAMSSNLRSVSATVAALAILMTTVIHLIAALIHPRIFAPIEHKVFFQLRETSLSLPMLFGCQTTFWQVYIGSSTTHSLTVCTLALSSILIINSRTLAQSVPVLHCLRAVGILLLLTSLMYSLWLSPITIAALPISLMM